MCCPSHPSQQRAKLHSKGVEPAEQTVNLIVCGKCLVSEGLHEAV